MATGLTLPLVVDGPMNGDVYSNPTVQQFGGTPHAAWSTSMAKAVTRARHQDHCQLRYQRLLECSPKSDDRQFGLSRSNPRFCFQFLSKSECRKRHVMLSGYRSQVLLEVVAVVTAKLY